MDAFLANLAKSVEQTILAALSAKLNEFATQIAELPELKEKGVTAQQIVDCWNSVSDYKIQVGAVVAAPSGDSSPASGDKKPRAKTDKNVKCQVLKTRGDNKGLPCGGNCVVGTAFCPAHLAKNQKTSPAPSGVTEAKAAPAATAEAKASEAKAATAEAKVPTAEGTCIHALETGKNKGSLCGKKATKDGKWCTTHGKKH